MKIVAKTLAGLEEILAKEIEQIGGENITIGTRMVSFLGDKKLLYKANLWLRTALRVLCPVECFEASDPDALYAAVKDIDWSKYIAEGQTIAIDNTVFSENFRNSRYALYRAKDAICDWFVERQLKRPKVAVATADVVLNLHITDEGGEAGKSTCQISLDASGEPLYKRGYKEQQTDAPISEVLAAGILLKAGYDGSQDLYDPMCGSGTFLIEAALIAANLPAGLYRKGFGFQRWQVDAFAYDEEMWRDLYDDDSQERPMTHHIYGSDISKVAIDITTENVKSAGLSRYISLEVKDFETVTQPPFMAAEGEDSAKGLVVMNPPYGKRLFTDVPTFYKMVGDVLKRYFKGCEAWIISSDSPEATFTQVDPATGFRREGTPFDFVGLKPSLKIDLNNGGIPCQLRKYELFSGAYEQFRKEGGELDKRSADQKQDNSHYDHVRRPRVASDKKKHDAASDGKKRFFDKDGKAYERGHKPAARKSTDKPFKKKEARSASPAYAVAEDGSLVRAAQDVAKATTPKTVENKSPRKPQAHTRDNEKTFHKKSFKKDNATTFTTGNFKRGVDGKLEAREGNHAPRGKREYDPNRPLFRTNFDVSKAVLDYSKPADDSKA